MPGAIGDKLDFFVSRRGSVAAVAQEVWDVLTEEGYKVFVQDYDIPFGASFIGAMHEGIKSARALIILYTWEYEVSEYTRREFQSFEAERLLPGERDRYIVVLRCEDAPLRGLLADSVYQDLVGVAEPEERRRRILGAAKRQSSAQRPQPRRGRTFVGVPPRIASFTGRADELDRLDAILTQDRPAAVTQVGRAAVQGLGGVGKTSLAVEYANRFRSLYDGVWWCPAETRTGLMTSLAALATELEVASPEDADVGKAGRAALRRLAEQGDIWLLVYDNVSSPEEIADLLPAAGARALITSRFSDFSGRADEVSLDVLPIEEAIQFLMDRAGRSDEAGARTLVEALGRLPLALDHAAAFCKRTQMSFAAYTANASRLIDEAPRGAPYPLSVAATFKLAIDETVKQRPAAEALMAFLAQCAPERVPMTLVEGAIDDEIERMAALAALAEVSLIKHDPFEDGAPAVMVHRLVQAVARARSEAKGVAHSATTRLIARLVTVYPSDSYFAGSWPRCTQLTPHLLSIWETERAVAATTTECIVLMNRVGWYFCGGAFYSDARSLFERALTIRETAQGATHPDTANSLHNLAFVLQAQGDLAAAQPLLERALSICEKAFGPEHLYTSTSLDNLAGMLQARGDFAGARPLYERVLGIWEKALGPDHPGTAKSRDNLARLLRAQGDLAGTRPLLERALAIREKAFGTEHCGTATTLDDLADLLQTQGDLAGAGPLFERALAIREKALGPEHTDTATSLNNLASLLQAQGDLAGARPLLERALDVREKALGSEHPDTANVLNNLGGLLRVQRDLAGARPLFERALAIREKALGPEHPDTVTVRNNLAKLSSAGEA
jgi:tetratricopeptide (TPR) repeat protein